MPVLTDDNVRRFQLAARRSLNKFLSRLVLRSTYFRLPFSQDFQNPIVDLIGPNTNSSHCIVRRFSAALSNQPNVRLPPPPAVFHSLRFQPWMSADNGSAHLQNLVIIHP